MWTSRAVLVACLALVVAACGEQRTDARAPQDPIVRGRLGAELDRFLGDSALEGFSGVVLVAKDDVVILKKGYGFANREHDVPNTTGTVFNICSISKVFTASAILHLEMQGKLSVSDRLEEHLGQFPEDKSSATIHHVLTHTAGLVIRGTEVDHVRRAAFVRTMKHAPIESAPGTEYRYTNAGYSLLAALVEVVSGQPFETYVHDYLLEPAGMDETTFRDEALPAEVRIAQGYQDESAAEPVDLDDFVWGYRGAGGMLATIGDLYAWELALRNRSVLSEPALQKMFTAYHNDEGYGWHVAQTDHGTTVHHRGCGSPGFQGQYARYPDDRVIVLLLSNNGRGWRRRIWNGLADKILPDEME